MTDERPNAWRHTVRGRTLIAAALLALWATAIEARLVYLQVLRHDDILAMADRQQKRTRVLAAKRGEMTDRNGRLLAYNVDVDTIFAVPSEVKDPKRAARELCVALETCTPQQRDDLQRRFERGGQYAYVERFVSSRVAAKVRALELPGIGLTKESQRFYPNRELAAQVLGYVGTDNVGLGGAFGQGELRLLFGPGTAALPGAAAGDHDECRGQSSHEQHHAEIVHLAIVHTKPGMSPRKFDEFRPCDAS